jgi:hypothetical protein
VRATLRFDLEDVFEREAHLRCCKALDMALALLYLREKLGYEACEEAFNKYNIDLDQLIS